MPIGLIIAMASIILVGVFIIINGSKPKREQAVKREKTYRKLYKILTSFFLSQSKILKIHNQIAMLSVYSSKEIMMLSTKYYLISTGISLALMLAAILLFKDALSMLMCIMFAILVNNVLIDKQIDKSNLLVFKALSKAVSAIRQEYLRLGSVAEAIGEAEYDEIVRHPMNEIYAILTSSNAELRLQEFFEATPFRTIQTLAGVAYSIHNYGDSKDEHGTSNFVQALTILASDINTEIDRVVRRKQKFGKIEYLPFVPVIGMPLFESYFMSIMPGTALIYNGTLGYIFRAVTILSCIFSYSTVSRINSTKAYKEDDRDIWVINLLRNKTIKNIVNTIVPKGRKAYLKEKKLKSVLSHMSLEQLYTKKLACAAFALILSLITAVSTVSLGRDFAETSTQQLSLVATNEMNEYEAQSIRALDKTFLEREGEWGEAELKALIKSYMPGLSDLQVLDQVKRLQDKQKTLANAYFKWWYFWICAVISVIGWFGPELMMILRKNIVEAEAEDDFLQLQTLVSIIMNTDADTLDALYQLSQHSKVHKDMLTYCYHCFPSNPEKELARLQSKTRIIEFKRFIGKLALTIGDLSLREAFGDLLMEREHTIKMREIVMNASLGRKRGLCGPLSMAPIILMVVGSLVLPLGILGIKEFMGALSSM